MGIYKEIKDKSIVLGVSQLAFIELLSYLFKKIDDNKLKREGSFVKGNNPFEIVLQHATYKDKCIVFTLHDEFVEISSNIFYKVDNYQNLATSDKNRSVLMGILEKYFEGDYKENEFFYRGELLKTEIEWENDIFPKKRIIHVSNIKYIFIYLKTRGHFEIKKASITSFF